MVSLILVVPTLPTGACRGCCFYLVFHSFGYFFLNMSSIQQGLQRWTATQKSFLTRAEIIKIKKHKGTTSIRLCFHEHFLGFCHDSEDLRPFVTTVLNLAVCCGLMEAARIFLYTSQKYLKLLYLRYCGIKVSFFCRSFIFH